MNTKNNLRGIFTPSCPRRIRTCNPRAQNAVQLPVVLSGIVRQLPALSNVTRRWQFAQRTSHLAISAINLTRELADIMFAIFLTLSPRWSNSNTRQSELPQSTQGWDWRYSRTYLRLVSIVVRGLALRPFLA